MKTGLVVLEIPKRERPALEVVLVTGFPTPESAARADLKLPH